MVFSNSFEIISKVHNSNKKSKNHSRTSLIKMTSCYFFTTAAHAIHKTLKCVYCLSSISFFHSGQAQS